MMNEENSCSTARRDSCQIMTGHSCNVDNSPLGVLSHDGTSPESSPIKINVSLLLILLLQQELDRVPVFPLRPTLMIPWRNWAVELDTHSAVSLGRFSTVPLHNFPSQRQ